MAIRTSLSYIVILIQHSGEDFVLTKRVIKSVGSWTDANLLGLAHSDEERTLSCLSPLQVLWYVTKERKPKRETRGKEFGYVHDTPSVHSVFQTNANLNRSVSPNHPYRGSAVHGEVMTTNLAVSKGLMRSKVCAKCMNYSTCLPNKPHC